MPFGAGHKNCLGQSLALQTADVLLGDFVRAFDVRPHAAYTPEFAQTPTLRFVNGLVLELKPVDTSCAGDSALPV